MSGDVYRASSQVDVFRDKDGSPGSPLDVLDVIVLETTLYLNIKREDPALVIIYNHLYVLGGFNKTSKDYPLNSIEMLSLTSSPTPSPTDSPSLPPTNNPTQSPSSPPSYSPVAPPTQNPTESPSLGPSSAPTKPTLSPLDPNFIIVTVPVVEQQSQQSQEFTFAFVAYSAVFFGILVGVIALFAQRHAKRNAYNFMMGALFRFLLCILDIEADTCFCINLLFSLYDNDDDVIWALFIASSIFLILPRIVGTIQMERFVKRYISEYDVEDGDIRNYFHQHACKLYGC